MKQILFHLLLVAVLSAANAFGQHFPLDADDHGKSAFQVSAPAKTQFASGEINVKSTYQPFEPIVVGCSCGPADANTTIKLAWEFDEACRVIPSPDGLTQYVWAPPGTHTVRCTIQQVRTQTLSVLVPIDPAKPPAADNLKVQTVTLFVSADLSNVSASFTVSGQAPQPPPKPDDPPKPPTPVGTGINFAVLIWEFSKLPKPAAATDLAVENYLNSKVGAANWRRWDDDPGLIKDAPAGLLSLWSDAIVAREEAGKGNDDPWIMIETKDGKKTGRPLDDNTLQFLKSYGG